VRHIDWTRLDDERAVLAQVWAALPAAQEQRDKAHLLSFLEHEGLVAESIQQGKALYAYADGPREPSSPVECEWYLEFRCDRDGGRLAEVTVEKRLIGP